MKIIQGTKCSMAAVLGAACICSAMYGCNKTDTKSPYTGYELPSETIPYSTISREPKTDWQAEWIWDDSRGTEGNVWMMFRTTVELQEVPQELTANIAVDSRYWLYINGNMVVFEGGAKRGPNEQDGYYDSVDISEHLSAGSNTIAVLVWYWGKTQSFSSIDSGRGGLIFEAISGDVKILSGDTWKVRRSEAYQNDFGAMQPNYRLPESNIYYDAREADEGWEQSQYDDSQWEQATKLGVGGVAPWNALYPRGIPLLKDFGLKDYVNSQDYANYTTKSEEKLTLNIPYNAQCTPYLKVEAEAGKEIVMTTENSAIGAVISTYVTKDGVQEFEALGWFNGEHITYTIPADVRIISLQYRETGYATEFSGLFESNDEFLNTLWQKSLRTLYVTMRDNFMDCPDRERAQWWGDVTNEMAMMMYSLDADSYLLYQKGVASMIGSIDPNTNVLETVVPISNSYFELPMQQLAGVCGFWTYYMYTGDTEFLNYVYEPALNYIKLWNIGSDGLVVHRGGSWDWMDWGDLSDVSAIENAWYYKALGCVIDIAETIGKGDEVQDLQERRSMLYGAYKQLWTDNGYKSSSVRNPDDRANALAVLAGLADRSQYETICSVLTTTMNASPYMERYVLDALCEMGYMDEAQTRIRTRYADMVAEDYSTLWELWDKNAGTMNHAWSGGPLLTMSQYMAGVAPTSAGYAQYSVKPQLGDLTEISCTVPSIKGYIKVDIKRDGETLTLELSSPADAEAVVGIPRHGDGNMRILVDGTVIFEDGKAKDSVTDITYTGSDSDYIYFTVKSRSDAYKVTLTAEVKAAASSGSYTVAVVQTEGGTITVNDSGEATQTFDAGTEITLNATVADGYTFAGWSGSVGGYDNGKKVTVGANMTIGAVFEKVSSDMREITVYLPEDCDVGILYNDILRTRGDDGAVRIYTNDESITLTACDGTLQKFESWGGGINSTDAAVTFDVSGDITITMRTTLVYGDNVAVGAKATCSQSMESGTTWSINNLTDGSIFTGFTTEVLPATDGVLRNPVTITIDLGEIKDFSLLSIAPRTSATDAKGQTPNFPTEFIVRVSEDGSSYTEVAHIAGIENPNGVIQSYDLDLQRARFVRIQVISVGTYAADESIANPFRVQLNEIMLRSRA